MTSAVHAVGADLDRIGALVRGLQGASVLDLGCGGGHVAFAAAAAGASVTAYDLSAEMLAAVTAEAERRGLDRSRPARAPPRRCLPGRRLRRGADPLQRPPLARRPRRPGGGAPGAGAGRPVRGLRSSRRRSPCSTPTSRRWSCCAIPRMCATTGSSEWRAMLETAGLVPGDTRAYRPRMEFASWIARMRTPEVNVAAIRALQGSAPVEIAAHFAIEADGSFLLDSVLIEARPARRRSRSKDDCPKRALTLR